MLRHCCWQTQLPGLHALYDGPREWVRVELESWDPLGATAEGRQRSPGAEITTERERSQANPREQPAVRNNTLGPASTGGPVAARTRPRPRMRYRPIWLTVRDEEEYDYVGDSFWPVRTFDEVVPH